MALNDSKIRAAKPLVKSYKLTDSQGLYLTISTSGAKLWYFRYRFEGKENRLAFGPIHRLRWRKPAKSAMRRGSCWHPESALRSYVSQKKTSLTPPRRFSLSPLHGTPVALSSGRKTMRIKSLSA